MVAQPLMRVAIPVALLALMSSGVETARPVEHHRVLCQRHLGWYADHDMLLCVGIVFPDELWAAKSCYTEPASG